MLPLASKCLLLLFCAFARGASLSADKSLLRREIKRRQPPTKPSSTISNALTSLWKKGGRDETQEALEPQGNDETSDKTKHNTCEDEFPIGVPGKSECLEPNFDYLTVDQRMCSDAASRLGFPFEGDHFVLHFEFFWQHPRGCFKIPCEHAKLPGGHMENATGAEKAAFDSGYCYFYNPVGINPPDNNGEVTGAPVCYRPKLLLGSLNLTTQNASCPRADFHVINRDAACSEAASCLGLCTGQDMDAGQLSVSTEVNSNFMHYPEGCFIENTTGCVYFNPRPHNWVGDPANITMQHTPICNVSDDTLANTWPTSAPTSAPSR